MSEHAGPPPAPPDAAPGPGRNRRGAWIAVGIVAAVAAIAGLAATAHRNPPTPLSPSSPWAQRTITSGGPTTTTFDPDAKVTFSDLPAYRGVAWADELQAEQQRFAGALPEDPVTGIGSGTFHGRYTNVVDGLRRTTGSRCGGCPSATIWLVGGSSAFGLGQRDEHTIASELTSIGDRHGFALDVQNMAVPGWTLWQEWQAVQQRLDRGDEPPDLIVSYGGYNDVAGGLTLLAVRGDRPGDHNVLDNEAITRFVTEGYTLADAGGLEAASKEVARRYEEVRRTFRARARALGIPTTFFFQPDAMASATQFAPVAGVVKGLPASSAEQLGRALELVSRDLEPQVVDLRHLLDREPRSLYADWAHTNERGARLAALAIYRGIAGELPRR